MLFVSVGIMPFVSVDIMLLVSVSIMLFVSVGILRRVVSVSALTSILMGVNEHEKLSNFTLKDTSKGMTMAFITVVHLTVTIWSVLKIFYGLLINVQ
jgi:hypothetical protein